MFSQPRRVRPQPVTDYLPEVATPSYDKKWYCLRQAELLWGDGGMFDRLRALMLLSECNGRDIWPVELCREKGVPEPWIEELADAFESGIESPLSQIYVDDHRVNHFFGVQDLHLAFKLGEYLGVNTVQVTLMAVSRFAQVRAIQMAVEEL